MDAFYKYDSITDDEKMTHQGFYDFYRKTEKPIQDLIKTTKYILSKFLKPNLKYKLDEIYSFENVFDLVILHSVIETFDGGIAEKIVKKYLEKKECIVFRDEILDRSYHIDFIATNPKTNKTTAIQVKPITFIFAILKEKTDTLKDGNSAFKKFDSFKSSDNNTKNVEDMYFIFYKVENNEIVFLLNQNTPLFKINTKEEINNYDWENITNNNNWIKLLN